MSTTLYTPRRLEDGSLRYLEDATLRVLETPAAVEIGIDDDDLDYNIVSGSFATGGTTLQLGYDGIDPRNVLLRFIASEAIAQGSTFSDAKLTIVPAETKNTSGYTITIEAAEATNPSMPADQTTADAITWTTAVASGNFGSCVDGTPADSPSLTSVLNEVSAGRAIAAGEAILLRVKLDNGTDSLAFAANEHASYAAARLSATFDAAVPTKAPVLFRRSPRFWRPMSGVR